jgi:hypothetical protein
LGRCTLFKPKAVTKRELLDALELEIEAHTQRSRVLKEESDKNRQKAADLAAEDMDDAAKRRLAVYLLCKQLRTKEEAIMADLDAARLQMVMQTDHPTSQTIEKVNKVLQESVKEKDKTIQAFSRMSFITQVNVEQSMTELEDYGIKQDSVEGEFRKLKGIPDQATPKPKKTQVKAKLPEVPVAESPIKETPSTPKEKTAEKS